MTLLNASDVEIVPFPEFEGFYYGFPYGFDIHVLKLFESSYLCEEPLAYARLLQRIGAPTWLMPYAPDEIADPFRRRMADVLQAINADIVLVPQAQRASGLVARLGNTIRFSYHSMGKMEQVWHYKAAYLPGFYHFDREGFSGWSELRNITSAEIERVSAERASEYYNNRIKNIISSRSSKYKQNEEESFHENDFVFVPLQLPDDSVIQLAYSDDYVGLMRESIRLMLRRGLKVVAKRHPLCQSSRMAEMLRLVAAEGCVITQASIHRILPVAKAVVTLNSGVGFEALLYFKPVICLGRADYSQAGWEAKHLEDLDAALPKAFAGKPAEFIKKFLFLSMNKYQIDLGLDISSKQHALRAICWNYLSLSRP